MRTVGLDFLIGAALRVICFGYCSGALRLSFVGGAYILGSTTNQARKLMHITFFLLYGALIRSIIGDRMVVWRVAFGAYYS